MSTMVTIFCCILSMLALRNMMRRDPKRLRVTGAAPVAKQSKLSLWLSRLGLYGPGVALAGMGDAAGFTIWLGVLAAFGWVLVAAPKLSAPAIGTIRAPVDRASFWLTARYASVRRLIEMPARLERLEIALADMQRRLDADEGEREDRAA